MKRKNLLSKIRKSIPILALALGWFSESQAQVSITSQTPYTQTFDGLPTASTSWVNGQTLTDWYSSRTGTIALNDGNVTTTGLYSFGSATDKALGSAGGGTTTNYGVLLQNNTNSTINSFTIQYVMEMWHRTNGNNSAELTFDYKINETSITASGYTSVAGGTNSLSLGGGGSDVLDGNLAANRNVLTFILSGISLSPGSKIMLRWTDENPAGNNAGIDDISITPGFSTVPATVYYSKAIPKNGTAYLNVLATWKSNSDGTGTTPTNFSNATFIIANQPASTISADWILGANAKAIVSEGNFTIPADKVFSGPVDVQDNATLTIQNTTLPTLGTLGALSTVIYSNQNQATVPSADYGSLTISNGDKKLSAKTRVKKNLSFNNTKLDLNGFDLVLDDDATISGAGSTGYIIAQGNGRLKRRINSGAQAIFPIGTDKAYLPITIAQTAGATPDTFTVKILDGIYESYTNNVPGIKAFSSYSVNKTWIIDEATPGGSNVTVTLTWTDTDASSAGFNSKTAFVSHYTNGAWDNATGSEAAYANGVYTLSRSGITSFSPFSARSGPPGSLPVELVSFNARRQNQQVDIDWQTAQEINNNYFAVERSLNGKAFTEIAQVKGAGNTKQASSYKFTDFKAPEDLVYYRLRQLDFDGSDSFSRIIAIPKATSKYRMAVELYPNPTSDVCYLRSQTAVNGPVEIMVTNTQGKVILNRAATAADLENGMVLDLKTNPKGIYFVTIRTSQEVVTLRAVQQ